MLLTPIQGQSGSASALKINPNSAITVVSSVQLPDHSFEELGEEFMEVDQVILQMVLEEI